MEIAKQFNSYPELAFYLFKNDGNFSPVLFGDIKESLDEFKKLMGEDSSIEAMPFAIEF